MKRVLPVLASVVMCVVLLPSLAQEAKKAPAKGRLPAYFGDVVDDAERQKIYDIQASYEPKIDKLEKELEALKDERDEKILKVLPAAKQKQVEAAKAAAAAKRDEKDKKDDKKIELPKGPLKVEPKK
jgi:hypothetical protein